MLHITTDPQTSYELCSIPICVKQGTSYDKPQKIYSGISRNYHAIKLRLKYIDIVKSKIFWKLCLLDYKLRQ